MFGGTWSGAPGKYAGCWRDPDPFAVSRDGNVIAPQTGNNFIYPIHLPEINAPYFILKINVNTTAKANAGKPGTYQIGKAADVGYVDFDVAEIIGYDQVLSGPEETLMNAYLMNKYWPTTVLSYADWATTKYSGYELTDPAADLDGDGMSNFAEYAFGLNPTTGASVNPVSPLACKTFSYTRTSNTGLTYTVNRDVSINHSLGVPCDLLRRFIFHLNTSSMNPPGNLKETTPPDPLRDHHGFHLVIILPIESISC
ncbi:MAG: hypothetical protein NTW21_03035 [Verrucomicrobia bacterium]|nr:hypothetical protein [Verrucomicrobiota bacterium]